MAMVFNHDLPIAIHAPTSGLVMPRSLDVSIGIVLRLGTDGHRVGYVNGDEPLALDVHLPLAAVAVAVAVALTATRRFGRPLGAARRLGRCN